MAVYTYFCYYPVLAKLLQLGENSYKTKILNSHYFLYQFFTYQYT